MANENGNNIINVLTSIHDKIKSLAGESEQIVSNQEKKKLIDSKTLTCFKLMAEEMSALSYDIAKISKVAENLVTSHDRMMDLFQKMTDGPDDDVEADDSNLPKYGDLYPENGEVAGWVVRVSPTRVEIQFMDDNRENEIMTLSEFGQNLEKGRMSEN
jgi:hypothetical protein